VRAKYMQSACDQQSKEGRRYFSYCQAQPQFQLSWAKLALVSIPPARQPVRNSSE
jgi:hypothetical protein